MNDDINELLLICRELGDRADLFQGGGGNISLKLDTRIMAIKASGLRIAELTADRGLVKVDFSMLQNFYQQADRAQSIRLDRESGRVVEKATIADGTNHCRPSIETGFHALLGKYVLHSHSVYANLITCAENGKKMVEELFPNDEALFVPFAPPGFYLTLEVKETIERTQKEPRVLFLKNHGLIVVGCTAAQALDKHKEVDQRIKNKFSLNDPYPEIRIETLKENKFRSQSPFLKKFIRENQEYFTRLPNHILFPDQTVFCAMAKLAGTPGSADSKICVNLEDNSLIYNASAAEAQTIEEILVAWSFILTEIKRAHLQAEFISGKHSVFIGNMESEKYRKDLLKK